MDEKQQIKKILKGDTSAFSYFVDTYQDMAITIAYRVCNNMQDAEDIVQDSFVKAYHNLHTFRFTSKFSTWLYRIVYNTAVTHARSGYYNIQFADYMEADNQAGGQDIIEILDEKDVKAHLDKAMGKLPRDLSLILTLFYLEENSIKDIVQITGLSQVNVKVKLHRARNQLAGILKSMPGKH